MKIFIYEKNENFPKIYHVAVTLDMNSDVSERYECGEGKTEIGLVHGHASTLYMYNTDLLDKIMRESLKFL